MKNKIVTILIASATIILAGVAVFTAVRLFQLRQESVSPAQPESKPAAVYSTGEVRVTCNPNDSSKKFDVTITQVSESPTCNVTRGQCPATTNNFSTYSTTYKVSVEPNSNVDEYNMTVTKNSNWCTEPCGGEELNGSCLENGQSETEDINFTKTNTTKNITVSRASDNGQACGSWQTDLWFTNIENCDTFTIPSSSDPTTHYSEIRSGTLGWGLCYTGIECPSRPSLCQDISVDKTQVAPNESVTITSHSKSAVKNFAYALYNEDNQYDYVEGNPTDNPKPICTTSSGYSSSEVQSITTETASCQQLGAAGSHHLMYKDADATTRTEGSVTIPYEYLFVKDELTGSMVSGIHIVGYFASDDNSLVSIPEGDCVINIYATEATSTPTTYSCSTVSFSLASATLTPTPTATATTTATPTVTATATSTGTPNSCNGTCGSNDNCDDDLYCYQGYCRNPSCPTETDCTCATATATATSTTTTTTTSKTATPTAEPSLPNAGVSTPTVFGVGIGVLLLLISLALAL